MLRERSAGLSLSMALHRLTKTSFPFWNLCRYSSARFYSAYWLRWTHIPRRLDPAHRDYELLTKIETGARTSRPADGKSFIVDIPQLLRQAVEQRSLTPIARAGSPLQSWRKPKKKPISAQRSRSSFTQSPQAQKRKIASLEMSTESKLTSNMLWHSERSGRIPGILAEPPQTSGVKPPVHFRDSRIIDSYNRVFQRPSGSRNEDMEKIEPDVPNRESRAQALPARARNNSISH